MRIIDILACYDINETPPKTKQSLLHATLASLLSAVELRHLSPAAVAELLAAAKSKWIDTLAPPPALGRSGHADFSEVSIDYVWNETLAVLSREDPAKYFRHLGMLAKPGAAGVSSQPRDVQLVSIQDVRMFKFWLRASEIERMPLEGGLGEYTAADVFALIEACKDASRLQPSPVVGRPKSVVWLTTLSGVVADLLGQAEAAARNRGSRRLEDMSVAYMARNRLGLWKKRSPEHGIAVVTSKTYESYLDELGTTIKAPTVFDAEGYDRFRHWPTSGTEDTDELGRGRTYELDPEVRTREHPNHGAPEIVATPRPLSEIGSMIYLGPFGYPPGHSPEDERRSYLEYAAEVSAGRSLQAVLVELERTFDL
jgi:hypothetical protein